MVPDSWATHSGELAQSDSALGIWNWKLSQVVMLELQLKGHLELGRGYDGHVQAKPWGCRGSWGQRQEA